MISWIAGHQRGRCNQSPGPGELQRRWLNGWSERLISLEHAQILTALLDHTAIVCRAVGLLPASSFHSMHELIPGLLLYPFLSCPWTFTAVFNLFAKFQCPLVGDCLAGTLVPCFKSSTEHWKVILKWFVHFQHNLPAIYLILSLKCLFLLIIFPWMLIHCK